MAIKMESKPISVSVKWAYEIHTCKLTEKNWVEILDGKPVNITETYWHEGEELSCNWLFKITEVGSLVVTYDDGGVHFDDKLADVEIKKN